MQIRGKDHLGYLFVKGSRLFRLNTRRGVWQRLGSWGWEDIPRFLVGV